MIVPGPALDPPLECPCGVVEVDDRAVDVVGIVVTCIQCGRRWEDYTAWWNRKAKVVA